jgi:hypothetical protein
MANEISDVIKREVTVAELELGLGVFSEDIAQTPDDGPSRVLRLRHRHLTLNAKKRMIILSQDTITLATVVMTEPYNEARCIFQVINGPLDNAIYAFVVDHDIRCILIENSIKGKEGLLAFKL